MRIQDPTNNKIILHVTTLKSLASSHSLTKKLHASYCGKKNLTSLLKGCIAAVKTRDQRGDEEIRGQRKSVLKLHVYLTV